MARIGMVGIGMMGHGIASNLVRKGHTLALLDHPGNQPVDDLKAAGAVSHIRSADLAAQSEVVILVLTGAPQVEAVLLGEEGALAALQPGTVVIDCSTAIPSSTESVARAVAAATGSLPERPTDRHPAVRAGGDRDPDRPGLAVPWLGLGGRGAGRLPGLDQLAPRPG